VADFNADGRPDFLIANTATRKTGIWTLDLHLNVTDASYIADGAGKPIVQSPGLTIVAP
jgi:hypothetical protein